MGCGVPLYAMAMAADGDALAARLHALMGPQGSNRWIKAINHRRRAHTPKPHDRSHGSVHRILRGAVGKSDVRPNYERRRGKAERIA